MCLYQHVLLTYNSIYCTTILIYYVELYVKLEGFSHSFEILPSTLDSNTSLSLPFYYTFFVLTYAAHNAPILIVIKLYSFQVEFIHATERANICLLKRNGKKKSHIHVNTYEIIVRHENI